MALLDQLRLLDRALRDLRVREALRSGDRGGRRLARFAGSVAPADLAVLRAVDARRFEAVAQRQAELIRDRWWTPRFPGVLLGTAQALGGTTRDVALGTLASPHFDRREGEDETGAALLGYVLGREDRTNDPAWLPDLVAYEYMISIGLPRRSKRLAPDTALEQRVLPEATRFLEPSSKRSGASDRPAPRKGRGAEISLTRKIIVLPLEFPVSQIRDALVAGQEVSGDLDAEPHVLAFQLGDDGATEHPFPARAHDLLDMVAAAPLDGARLLASFEADDRLHVYQVLGALLDAGILAGPRPAEPPPPEPQKKSVKGAMSAKGAKGAEPAKKPAKAGKAPVRKGAPSAAKRPAPKPAPTAPAGKPAASPKKPAAQKGAPRHGAPRRGGGVPPRRGR